MIQYKNISCDNTSEGIFIEVGGVIPKRFIFTPAYIISLCQDMEQENPNLMQASSEKPYMSLVFDPEHNKAITKLLAELQEGEFDNVKSMEEYLEKINQNFTLTESESVFVKYHEDEWQFCFRRGEEWTMIPYNALKKAVKTWTQ